jgi:hypothetical protein
LISKIKIWLKKRAYKKSFQRAKKDPQIIELAEWGMDDYAKQLDDFNPKSSQPFSAYSSNSVLDKSKPKPE